MASEDKKDKAARKIKLQSEVRESRRLRRTAREDFTNQKATGKIPKDMTFGEFKESKFFRAKEANKRIQKERKGIEQRRRKGSPAINRKVFDR